MDANKPVYHHDPEYLSPIDSTPIQNVKPRPMENVASQFSSPYSWRCAQSEIYR